MKNILTLASLSLLCMPVFAQDDDDDFIFYAGLAGGVAYNSAEINRQTESITTVQGSGQLVSEGHVTYTGDTQHFTGAGQVQIGAGLRFDFLYLGLEALGQLSNGEFDTIHGTVDHISEDGNPSSYSNFDVNLKLNDFEPAIDFKPGLFLSNNTLLYGRIGAAFNEASLTDQSQSNLGQTFDLGTVDATESEDLIALRLGLGVEHHLHDRFNIFMDYTYTSYGDISIITQNHASAALGQGFVLLFDFATQNKADDINKQALMLGFNYYL